MQKPGTDLSKAISVVTKIRRNHLHVKVTERTCVIFRLQKTQKMFPDQKKWQPVQRNHGAKEK